MGRKVTELDDDGKPISYKLTRAQRKSLQEMPWTAGPQTRWQKFKRAAIH